LKAISKALSILDDGSIANISQRLGDQHKIRSFYNNIIAPDSPAGDVTIDTHAVAAGHIRPMGGSTEEVLHNFGGAGAPSNSVMSVLRQRRSILHQRRYAFSPHHVAGALDVRIPAGQTQQSRAGQELFQILHEAGLISANPAGQLSSIQVKADESTRVRPFEPREYRAILAAVSKSGLQPHNAARVRACMQLQRWSGLSLVDAVCLSKDELIQAGKTFRVRTQRRKTGVTVNNVIPAWLGKELLTVKNGNRTYFFISGEATPKGAVSVFDKMYRQAFKAAGIDGTSHMLRHTFSVELLKAGVDIRKVSKALGHTSVTITERYYAKWNKAQQDILDGDLASAW
jgi:integrase